MEGAHKVPCGPLLFGRIANSVHGTGTGTSNRAMNRYKVGVCLRWWDLQNTLRHVPVIHKSRNVGIVINKKCRSQNKKTMMKQVKPTR